MKNKVDEINNKLRSYGGAATQEVNKGYKKFYGYKPQYVFDAVNEFVGPGNWSNKVLETRIDGEWASASVAVTMLGTTREQWGTAQIMKGNIGDGIKGSITDAIQKCFALMSIGCDAYRGELEKVYGKPAPQDTSSLLDKLMTEVHSAAKRLGTSEADVLALATAGKLTIESAATAPASHVAKATALVKDLQKREDNFDKMEGKTK